MHAIVKFLVSAGFHIFCLCSRDAGFRENAATDTSLVLQQDRIAHVAFVKPPAKRWHAAVGGGGAHGSAALGASSVVIASSLSTSPPTTTIAALASTIPAPSVLSISSEAQAAPSDQEATVDADLAVALDSIPTRLRAVGEPMTPKPAGFEQEADEPPPPRPALYAVVAAIGASFGYMGLVLVRCIGLLREFAPKTPLEDFVKAPRKSFRAFSSGASGRGDRDGGEGEEAAAPRRTRRPQRPAPRLCCPTRPTPVRFPEGLGSRDAAPRLAAAAPVSAQVPPIDASRNEPSTF